ncbi:MAG: four helix bundle protein [Deltaproteobacteria bacterium]|nr:four helix bundle protein [Deltaproteobacteria bacterium]
MKIQFDANLDFPREACETKVWIEFARRYDYFDESTCEDLDNAYDRIIGQFVKMIQEADKWLIR